MTVRSSARLKLAANASFYDWENPFEKSLLKGLDERAVLTERRRVMVRDIAGGRRPLAFIGSQNVHCMPASRHEQTLRLRRLERKVLVWKNLWRTLFGLLRPSK